MKTIYDAHKKVLARMLPERLEYREYFGSTILRWLQTHKPVLDTELPFIVNEIELGIPEDQRMRYMVYLSGEVTSAESMWELISRPWHIRTEALARIRD